MKPFNLEEALSGKKVVTRDGREVTELHLFKVNMDFPLSVVVDKHIESFTKDGQYYYETGSESPFDLFMASGKVTKWVNVYLDREIQVGAIPFDSEAEAKEFADRYLIATVPITFEV